MSRWILIVSSLMFLFGCSSIRTTVLERTPEHQLVENPDRPLKGMPVMLRVPSHLDVTVNEVHTWVKGPKDVEAMQLTSGRAQFDVDCKLIEIEKMFVVDPLRPLSGDQEYGFGFYQPTTENSAIHPGQLKSMAYKSVDTSIRDVAALAGAVIQRVRQASAQNTTSVSSPAPVFTTSCVVAFRRFDINEPDFEESVRAFLSEAVNSRDFHQKRLTLVSDQVVEFEPDPNSNDSGTDQ